MINATRAAARCARVVRTAAVVVAVTATAAANGQSIDTSLQTRVDQYLAPYLAMNDFAGTILVAKKGKIVLDRSYGLANRETGTPIGSETEFRIGSVSKQFTAAAVLVLVDRGAVDLEAPLVRYIPGIPNGSRITVRQLLTHTGGAVRDLPDKRRYSTSPHPMAELLAAVRTTTPASEPGAHFSYSNIDYLLLAGIIEKVSGQSYGAFLDSALFKPLGMTHTGVDSTELLLPGRASGYQTGVGTTVFNAHFEDMSNEVGYGSLYSTAGDLLRWEQAWQRSPVLTAASWRAMFTDYGHGYGFGIGIHDELGHKLVGHDGTVPGFGVFVRLFPDDSVAIVFTSNVESGLVSELEDHLADLFVIGKSVPSVVRPSAATVPMAVLHSYEGSYQVAPGFVLDVKEIGGVLHLRGGPGEWWFAMTPLSTTRFLYRHLFADVTFTFGADGHVTGMSWTSSSGEFTCKKVA